MLTLNKTQKIILKYLTGKFNKSSDTKSVLLYVKPITNETFDSIMGNIKELNEYGYIRGIMGLITYIEDFKIISSYSWIKNIY